MDVASGRQGRGVPGGRRNALTPVVLFGAFDRHNFGDLLLAHVAAALVGPRRVAFTGLASRDLRRLGGQRVTALAQWLAQQPGGPVTVLHVGGEVLACSAWEAAVMLLPPREVQSVVAYLEPRPRERERWVRRVLGTAAPAPYLVPREWLPPGARVLVHAAGGMDLDRRDPALRRHVLDRLRAADDVSVRDHRTEALLQAAGIAVRCVPDPAALVAELFGDHIARHAARGEPARVQASCPRGWIAAQFSAEFGDDATLRLLAVQLDAAARRARCGVVLLRAGAAPWHDDLRLLKRAAACMAATPTLVCASLHAWDICALVAGARAYAGSSLHGRIVAMAHGVPRVGLRPAPGAAPTKQGAYAATWEEAGSLPHEVAPAGLADALLQAMQADRPRLARHARRLAVLCRDGYDATLRRLRADGS